MSLPERVLCSQGGVRDFAITHWSVVLQAQDPQAPQARDALGRLCRVKLARPHDALDCRLTSLF